MEKEIETYKIITDWYEKNIFENLKLEAKKIQEIFNKTIKDNSLPNELVSSNSVHSNYYFSVKKRVKSSNSLLEKFVRKNIGLDLSSKIKIEGDSFNVNKSIVENYIKKDIDDIIGLRVVCDLKEDCHKVIKIIKDKESVFSDEKIVFNLGELDNQPQKMRNGLDIYRIKGCYDNRISFELQVKSKIEEAWGELDHFIIYKDYSFFASKDTVQYTMNNVGHLLDKIENLLYDLRSTRVEYDKSLLKNQFLTDLERLFSLKLKDIFGFEYPMQGLTDVLYSIINLSAVNKDNVASFNLDFNISTEYVNNDIKNFIICRNKSYELKLIEKIYLMSDCALSNNYETSILGLVKKLKERIKNDISKSELVFEQDFDSFYDSYYSLFISCQATESLWISSKSVIDAFNDMKMINVLMGDSLEDIEEESDELEVLESLKVIIASLNFNCDIKLLIAELSLSGNAQFEKTAISLKEKCENNKNQYMQEDQFLKLKLSLTLISSEL